MRAMTHVVLVRRDGSSKRHLSVQSRKAGLLPASYSVDGTMFLYDRLEDVNFESPDYVFIYEEVPLIPGLPQ